MHVGHQTYFLLLTQVFVDGRFECSGLLPRASLLDDRAKLLLMCDLVALPRRASTVPHFHLFGWLISTQNSGDGSSPLQDESISRSSDKCSADLAWERPGCAPSDVTSPVILCYTLKNPSLLTTEGCCHQDGGCVSRFLTVKTMEIKQNVAPGGRRKYSVQ